MVYIRRLTWNPLNVEHIHRHRVTPDEVDEVCHLAPLVQQGYGGRTVLIGPTSEGRMLEVVLDPEGNDVYYVVTAHPASRKDRALYQQEMKGEGT
jgi:hypothetical protein